MKKSDKLPEIAFPTTFVWDWVPPNRTQGCIFTNEFVYPCTGMEVGFCKGKSNCYKFTTKPQSSHRKCWTERALHSCPACGKLARCLQTTLTTHRRCSLWGSDSKNYSVGSLHLRAISRERISWKLSPTSNSNNWRNKLLSPHRGIWRITLTILQGTKSKNIFATLTLLQSGMVTQWMDTSIPRPG